MVVKWKIKELLVFGDSQLVINQVNDNYDIKNEKLIPYKHMVDNFLSYFHMITFEQIPQAQNKVVDSLATIGYLLHIPNNVSQFEFLAEQLLVPTYDIPKSEMVCELVGPNSPWYQDMQLLTFPYFTTNPFQ